MIDYVTDPELNRLRSARDVAELAADAAHVQSINCAEELCRYMNQRATGSGTEKLNELLDAQQVASLRWAKKLREWSDLLAKAESRRKELLAGPVHA